jgi:hypothetical protein
MSNFLVENSGGEEKKLEFNANSTLYEKLKVMNTQFRKDIKTQYNSIHHNSKINKYNKKDKLKKFLIFQNDEKLYFKGASQFILNKYLNSYNNKILHFNSNKSKSLPNCIRPNHSTQLKLQTNNNDKSQNKSSKGNHILSLSNQKNHNNIRKINSNSDIYKIEEEVDLVNGSKSAIEAKYSNLNLSMNKTFHKEMGQSIYNKYYDKYTDQKIIECPYYLHKDVDKKVGKEDLDDKLKYLQNLIIKQTKYEPRFSAKTHMIEKQMKKNYGEEFKENEIMLGGIKYNYVTDIGNIAKYAFVKCGYYNKKIVN